MSPKGRNTFKEIRLTGISELHKSSNVLRNISNVARDLESLVSDGKKVQAIKIAKSICKAAEAAAATIEHSTKRVNSEQSCYLREAENAIKVAERRKQASLGMSVKDPQLDLEAINAYTKQQKGYLKTPTTAKKGPSPRNLPTPTSASILFDTPSSKKTRYHGPATAPPELMLSPTPPVPHNGREYSPSEMVSIFSGIEKSKKRKIIAYWHSVGLIPVKHTQAYDLLAKANKGDGVPITWNAKGRPRYLEVSEIIQLGESTVFATTGKGTGSKELSEAMVAFKQKKAEQEGFHPDTVKFHVPSRQTIIRATHMVRLGSQRRIRVCEKAIAKSQSRQIAERSIRSAVCLFATRCLCRCRHDRCWG